MIKEKFLETIKEYQMLDPGDHVLVAVSGGVDSLALLYLLKTYAEELKISLSLAHLNHLIRKEEAILDAQFVENLAGSMGFPIKVETFAVPAFAQEKKMNLEEAARKIRYDFLEKVAQERGANKIAVGHTADDNIETFLMRLIRGSGMAGLCGIPPQRGKIIRPLIKIWRREIEDYVGGLKLVPRRDYTNYESKYLRNLVRMKLLPQLKLYNQNIKEILLQTTFLLTPDYLYLEEKAEKELKSMIVTQKDNTLEIDLAKFKKNAFLQGHLLRQAVEKLKGNLTNLSFIHIQEILKKLNSSEKWELHLPAGLYAICDTKTLTLTFAKTEKEERKPFAYKLKVPGEIEIPELGIKMRSRILKKPEGFNFKENSPQVAWVNGEILSPELLVRNRQEGDRFCPLGVKGSKKLQDFFVDEKVPQEERDKIPIVENNQQIIWVAGYRIDERAKITEQTQRVIKLEIL